MEWNYQVNKILTPKNPCNLSFFLQELPPNIIEVINLEDEELDKILCSLPSTTKSESEVPPKQPMQEELDTLKKDVQNLQSLLEKNHLLLERLVNENANHLAHLHLLILGQKAQYTKVYYILFFLFY